VPAQIQSLSGIAAALQNNDEPQRLQNPYSTAGSGEYHVNVSFASKLTWEGGAAVAAM
jgi:hypothetical protein